MLIIVRTIPKAIEPINMEVNHSAYRFTLFTFTANFHMFFHYLFWYHLLALSFSV